MPNLNGSRRRVRRPFRRLVAGLLAASVSILFFLVAAKWLGLVGDDSGSLEVVDIKRGEYLIEKPRYVASSNDGRAIIISADWATPAERSGNQFQLKSVVARSQLLGVDEVRIEAESATYNAGQRTVEMAGGVVLTDSDGQRISTEGITIDAKSMTLRAESGVYVEMHDLEIEAGNLLLLTGENDRRGVFSGGVRAVYHPAQTEDGQ